MARLYQARYIFSKDTPYLEGSALVFVPYFGYISKLTAPINKTEQIPPKRSEDVGRSFGCMWARESRSLRQGSQFTFQKKKPPKSDDFVRSANEAAFYFHTTM